MQSLIAELQAVFNGSPALMIGYALLGLLVLQSLAMLTGRVSRLAADRRQADLTRQRLELQIKTAMIRHEEAEQSRMVWSGYRKFTVARKVFECEDVYSFYLVPHDGKPLPPFKPGQYLTFSLSLPGQAKPVIRCYSLSDSHRKDCYRVTIKRALPPPDSTDAKPGIVSSYFCDSVKEGDILDVKAPGGHFFLDLEKERPVVLISGGVGVTPMVSMLNAILDSGLKREVWFFFGARNRSEHILKEHLDKVAKEHDHVRIQVCYSRPGKEDRQGIDYQHAGRVTVDLFKQLLPSNNYDYFLCGPGAFMNSITDDLRAWGVPDSCVFFEAFGPATVKKAAPKPVAATAAPVANIDVTFSKAGKTVRWRPEVATLLDLAEESGIKIEAGCRAGNCGTCLVAIKSGTVDYVTEHGAAAEEGSCLTCICKPKANLVLDA
jgi:hypothetical protein